MTRMEDKLTLLVAIVSKVCLTFGFWWKESNVPNSKQIFFTPTRPPSPCTSVQVQFVLIYFWFRITIVLSCLCSFDLLTFCDQQWPPMTYLFWYMASSSFVSQLGSAVRTSCDEWYLSGHIFYYTKVIFR